MGLIVNADVIIRFQIVRSGGGGVVLPTVRK
jgi:hypothetical protein